MHARICESNLPFGVGKWNLNMKRKNIFALMSKYLFLKISGAALSNSY